MFNFFLPSKTKQVLSESELIQGNLQRNRIYAQDILSTKDLETIMAYESRYPALLKAHDVAGLELLNKEVMKLGKKLFPPSPCGMAGKRTSRSSSSRRSWRSPFAPFSSSHSRFPTGSMEPTLFGIEPVPSIEQPPNIIAQAFEFLIHGKTYSRVVTPHGGTVDALTPGSFTIWLEYTDVHLTDAQGAPETDRIWIRPSDVRGKLGIREGMQFNPGDVLANYVTQTGDQVLVDKVTYNFRPSASRRSFYLQDLRHSRPRQRNRTGPGRQRGFHQALRRPRRRHH